MQKITVFVVVTSMLILMLGGCSLSKSQDDKTKYSVWKNISTKNEELNTYLEEDNEVVKQTEETVQGFIKALTNRDYKTIEGDEEYGYYTKEFHDDLVAKGSPMAMKNGFIDYELACTLKAIQINSIKFNNNKDFCIVDGDVEYMVTHAAKDNPQNTLEINKTYGGSVTLELKTEDNIWKVDSYELGKVNEVK